MIIRTRARLALVAASLLAAAACESAVNSDDSDEGTLSFSYAGVHSGSFSATGAFDRLRPNASPWAVGNSGTLQTGRPAIGVYARADRNGDSLVDEFLMLIEDPGVGTFTCTDATTDCPMGAFLVLGTTPTGQDAEAIYASVSGTVNITAISQDHATGNFVMTMEGFNIEDAADSVQVTSGTFNVPVIRAVN
jgi:hypothetical protein